MTQSRENRRQLYERLVGQTVAGRYQILSLMGFGGMGAVYEAMQQNMNRRVALKYIPSHDPVTAARFEREALTVSQLRHPNTVTVFDYGQTNDGFLFLSMELLSGRTLTDLIKENSPLPPERAVHIASQICRSLAEAHEMGIVHRDIKPDNVILIEVDGDPDVTKVLDFGIAKAVGPEEQETLTGDGRIVGTPRYMSPEQILSEDIDHRSDIYSLGCIIFEMLCGAPPFEARSTTALMISHAQDPPPPFAERLPSDALSHIPSGLEQVVRRAMAKSPWERPQSTEELRRELEEALEAHRAGRQANITEAPEFSGPPLLHGGASAGSDPSNSEKASLPLSVILAAGGVAILLVAVLAMGSVILLGGNSDEFVEDPAQASSADPGERSEPMLEGIEEQRADDTEEPVLAVVSVTDTIHARIETSPSGATVHEGDREVGTTPLNLSLTADTSPLTYRLTRSGYRSKEISLEVDPEGSSRQVFSYDLQRRRARPVARPAPPPDDDDDVPAIQLLLD